MSEFLHAGAGGRPVVRLVAADGATAEVSLYGGHVLAWTPAGESGSRLFLSDRAEYADGRAVRGGVPVIFPQFSDRGPYGRHGIARTALWTLEHAARDATGRASATLVLDDTPATRAAWPFAFRLRLTVAVEGPTLEMRLAAENPGDTPYTAAFALHTYLAALAASAHIDGVGGQRYVDAGAGDAPRHAPPGRLDLDGGPIDRIYLGVPGEVRLGSAGQQVEMAMDGFEDVVVWNPGPVAGSALVDLAPLDAGRFVCVEAARIGRPVTIAPGSAWEGRCRLSARR